MLVCESCGSENPDDVHFCVMCGAFLSKPAPSGPASELPAPDAPQPELRVPELREPRLEAVQPGATASFRVTVRNTGALVEGCTVSVRGIPAAWQRMEPDRFNLDVDQQTDVQVHITPPRSPKTTAGRTALAIVVRSEVNEE